jgi:hypothetical protein
VESIGDALQEVVDTLTAAGVPASTEPGELDLPGAFVVPGVINFDLLSGDDYSMVIDIYLLTPNNGAIEAINSLQDMLVKVRTVYGVPNAEPMSLPLGNGQEALPGLLISLQATITKD